MAAPEYRHQGGEGVTAQAVTEEISQVEGCKTCHGKLEVLMHSVSSSEAF